MTQKQRAAFLKRERFEDVGDGWWKDTKTGMPWDAEKSVAIATRRKSARDTRRLKAAGWETVRYHNTNWPVWWKKRGITTKWVTKSEALRILEGR